MIVSLIVNALSVYITGWLLSTGVHIPDLQTALFVALALGIINTLLKPILLVLTLPINLLSLGLFTFVLNALLILLVGSIVKDFTVDSFWWALAFSLVLSVVNMLLEQFVK